MPEPRALVVDQRAFRGESRPAAATRACSFLIMMATCAVPGASMTRLSGVTVPQPGSVAGAVTDESGQPLPGVIVAALPQAGGLTRRTTSASDGTYRFDGLSDVIWRIDFELLGFDLIRRNQVRVNQMSVNAALPVSSICECITIVPSIPLRERAGQVVDQAGRPLPHARLEVVSPMRRELRYADSEGRFVIRLAPNETWPLTASDTGFRALTKRVSGAVAEPIELRLIQTDGSTPSETERFGRGCRCPGDLFAHEGR
jgi:hypothetical protein